MIKFITLFLSLISYAGVDKNVLVSGVVGNIFDDSKVKVTDSFNQTYFLPRSVFPKDFSPQSGKPFQVEVHQDVFNKIEILKKKK